MKKLLSILLVVVLSMAAFACNDPVTSEEGNVKITLSETTLTLAMGDQHAMTATVEGSEESVVWASSNTSVVKVNKFGMLQALALGSADITASIGDVSAKCAVTVKAMLTPDVASITLIAPADGLSVDLSSKKVSFTANPELAAGEELTYSSSNEAVAVVEDVVIDEAGTTEKRISAKGIGSAVITATAPNGAVAEVAVAVEGLNAAPTALTFEITTAEAVPAWCGVFLAGTLSAWGPADGYELTRVDDTTFRGTFTFDFSDEVKFPNGDAQRNAEYKFILSSKAVDGEGNVVYGSDTGWEQVNGSNVDNRKIFVNADETVALDGIVFQSVPANPEKPEVTNTINITLTFTAAIDHDVYLIGAINEWAVADANYKFTASADKKTFTLNGIVYASKADSVEVKLNKGDWDWNYGSSDGITWTKGGDNYKLPLTGDIAADNTRTINLTWNIDNTPVVAE